MQLAMHAGIVRREFGDCGELPLENALLATSEIVTNAIQNADGPYLFTVCQHALSGRLRISVTDNNHEPLPPVAKVHPSSARGRGLFIVNALAASWGATPTAHGKEVWFEMTRTTMTHLDSGN